MLYTSLEVCSCVAVLQTLNTTKIAILGDYTVLYALVSKLKSSCMIFLGNGRGKKGMESIQYVAVKR